MKISEKRQCAEKLKRAGLAELAIDMINDFDGSYKGAIELAGKLSVISQASTFDDYWNEQSSRGRMKAEALLEYRAAKIIK